ncbi:MAG: ABC transporter ATP-binding protein, partial [Albidovulum sp.]|nr:ABC transporter ATP-binding protein [Albidovulum sp.]
MSELEILDLSVSFATGGGDLQALNKVTFKVPEHRIVGIVGESGCGKSTLIDAILGLLADNGRIDGGEILFEGRDLTKLGAKELREIRGPRISTVFQDPMGALNPVFRVGRQMTNIQYRSGLSKREKARRAAEMLRRVRMPDPEAALSRYPHEFSGGMKQRIAIAMAMMMEPALLIADEPTTALDATLEAATIDLLLELQNQIGCSMLYVSHHMGVIAELCDEVVVMYAGEVVERGTTRQVFLKPRHPYTQRLIECDPARLAGRAEKLPTIPGDIPDLRA